MRQRDPWMYICGCNRIIFLYIEVMPPQLTFSEMSHLAWSLCALSKGESELARTALAWTFRNRLEGRGEAPSPCSLLEAFGQLGTASGSVAPGAPLTGTCDFQSPDFCVSLSSLCMVWSDSELDPTEGALSFHRHDQLPRWARSIDPCALIGSYFFYRQTIKSAFTRGPASCRSERAGVFGSS